MKFGRNIEFVCFSFHVGLLVITLSSFKLHTKNNACFFWKSWVQGSEKNRLFVGWLFAGWLWKEPVLMQKMLKIGVPWPSHTLGVALATGRLRRRWCPETDLTSSRWDAVSAHWRRRQEPCTHALASSPRCVRVRRLCVPNIMSLGVCFKKNWISSKLARLLDAVSKFTFFRYAVWEMITW